MPADGRRARRRHACREAADGGRCARVRLGRPGRTLSGPDLHVVEIVGLLASPAHRYDGRPGEDVPDQADDRHERLAIRAGFGIVGDRYAGRPAHRDASVTVIGAEPLDELAEELGVPPFDPLLTRRNVVLRGADVESLRGRTFALDCGEGVVVLRGGRPANPCGWMDVVLAPGAHRGMRGRGGIRCAPDTGGVLRLGPALLTVQPSSSRTAPGA